MTTGRTEWTCALCYQTNYTVVCLGCFESFSQRVEQDRLDEIAHVQAQLNQERRIEAAWTAVQLACAGAVVGLGLLMRRRGLA